MKHLKKISFLYLVAPFLSCCTSSIYKVDKQETGKVQILVTRDRVRLECYKLKDHLGDMKDAHLFSIYVLDESKTVVSVSQGSLLVKEDCDRRLRKIEPILKSGNRIYIGGMGTLDKARTNNMDVQHSFPGWGQFPENGRVLQFMAIWNDAGLCYNAYSGDRKPCPSDEFPLENDSKAN